MKPLTIGIEASFAGALGAERHGIYRYLEELLRGFQAVGAPHRLRLWFNSFRQAGRDGVDAFLEPLRSGPPHATAVVSRLPSRLKERVPLPAEWFTGPLDVFHSPTHLLPALSRARGLVTIHDLAFLRMPAQGRHLDPAWCAAIRRRSPRPRADLEAYRRRCRFFGALTRGIRSTLGRADGILAVSEATARDLEELAGVPRARIRVVPNGSTPGMRPATNGAPRKRAREWVGVDGPYVLYVGVLDPNKDLETLLRAFACSSDSFRAEHRLLIVGPRNWFQPILEELAADLGIREQVVFGGFVPQELLPALYSAAVAAVSPSPFEGFGFPVLEAMACETPAIVVDAGALPEVAGEAALRVPAREPEPLAAALERVASDEALASELVRRGRDRCREFSWERTARQTLAFYEELAG